MAFCLFLAVVQMTEYLCQNCLNLDNQQTVRPAHTSQIIKLRVEIMGGWKKNVIEIYFLSFHWSYNIIIYGLLLGLMVFKLMAVTIS